MNITLVPVHHVDNVWPRIAEAMERSCRKSGGALVAGDVWQACRSGSAYLIIAHDETEIAGASVWYLDTGASGAKLRCMALGGAGMSRWISDMHQMVKRLARDCGANSLVSYGRKGWAKIFPKAKPVRIEYEEPLDGR